MQIPTLETIVVAPKLPAKNCIIWLHGLGADGHDFTGIIPELHLPENLAIRFVFPHAPIRPVTLNNGFPMRAWFDVYGLTKEHPQDEKGIELAYQSLLPLIEKEMASGISPHNIVLAGFSQGGALALYTGLRYPQQLGGIVGLSTFLPLHYQWDINTAHVHSEMPIFMAHGELDPLLSLKMGQISKDYLVKMGYKIEWHTYPMAHTVCPQEILDIAKWLTTILLKTHDSPDTRS